MPHLANNELPEAVVKDVSVHDADSNQVFYWKIKSKSKIRNNSIYITPCLPSYGIKQREYVFGRDQALTLLVLQTLFT